MHMHMHMQDVTRYFWDWVVRSFGASFLRWVGCVISTQIIDNTFRCKQKGWLAGSQREPSRGFPAGGREASNKSVSSRWELVLGMISYRCQPRHGDSDLGG